MQLAGAVSDGYKYRLEDWCFCWKLLIKCMSWIVQLVHIRIEDKLRSITMYM